MDDQQNRRRRREEKKPEPDPWAEWRPKHPGEWPRHYPNPGIMLKRLVQIWNGMKWDVVKIRDARASEDPMLCVREMDWRLHLQEYREIQAAMEREGFITGVRDWTTMPGVHVLADGSVEFECAPEPRVDGEKVVDLEDTGVDF